MLPSGQSLGVRSEIVEKTKQYLNRSERCVKKCLASARLCWDTSAFYKLYSFLPLSGMTWPVPWNSAEINIRLLLGRSGEPNVVKKQSLRSHPFLYVFCWFYSAAWHHSFSFQTQLQPARLEKARKDGPETTTKYWTCGWLWLKTVSCCLNLFWREVAHRSLIYQGEIITDLKNKYHSLIRRRNRAAETESI